jgi:hypothetical protein
MKRTYPPLAQLQTTLVLAVLQQLHSALLQRRMAGDFTNDLTHELNMLAEFLQTTFGCNQLKLCWTVEL